MVSKQVVNCTCSRTHRHTGRPCIVILYHIAGRAHPFEVVSYVGGGGSHRRFNTVSISVIHERRCCRPAHPHQAILRIIAQCIRAP